MSDNPVLRDAASLPEAVQFRAAVDSAPIAIACISAETGRYVFVNETFARMHGRTQHELVNADPYAMFLAATHPDERAVGQQALDRIGRGEADRQHFEKRVVAKNGTERWVSVELAATRNAAARLTFITVYLTDIHAQRSAQVERKWFEDELRHAQKLETLGRLAGGVAHDFNNRLVVIMGYAQLVKERLPAGSPLKAHVGRVIESAVRAAELTQQLLTYGRRQAALEPKVFDIGATIDNMRRVLERVVGDEVELATRSSATHPNVLGDPACIEQVILNLAINARDAMPNGGRLTVEIKNVTLAAKQCKELPAGDYVALLISDSGSGIPKHVLPHIFEPFFTTKQIGRGTGLGLATVQSIVQQSGGAIHVESSEGRGTTFTIFLPRASRAPEQPRDSEPNVSPRVLNFETVLLCDEDAEVRELIANVLGLRGYRVLQARNAPHALEIADAEPGPIHLLVTDPTATEIDGVDLVAKLRSQQPQLAVLYIAGHDERVSLMDQPLDAKTQVLQKPFMPGDLTRTVWTMLEQPPAT